MEMPVLSDEQVCGMEGSFGRGYRLCAAVARAVVSRRDRVGLQEQSGWVFPVALAG